MAEEGVSVNISWVPKRILGNGRKVNGAVAGPDPVSVSGRGTLRPPVKGHEIKKTSPYSFPYPVSQENISISLVPEFK